MRRRRGLRYTRESAPHERRASDVTRPGPLLRLVHSLERRRAGRSYRVRLELRRLSSTPGGGASAASTAALDADVQGPRAFILGSGERVDLTAPHGLLPRHVAVLTVPYADGVQVRILSLHPDKGLVHLRRDAALEGAPFPSASEEDEDDDEGGLGATLSTPVGGLIGWSRAACLFEGYLLEVSAELERPSEVVRLAAGEPRLLAKGEQLAFFNGSSVRPVGNVVSSVGGPGGGGHAVPALVAEIPDVDVEPGSLVLRSRDGVHRIEPTPRELRRGILIGRSRRCVLGRGFDENDGLSRLHALVMLVDDGVYAFDLASRYGLRDVARPNRLIYTARLDDGVGCLVYGAGHLLFER